MDIVTRRQLLQAYRKERELTNITPIAEATGRTFIPIPGVLSEIGKTTSGVKGYVELFRQMLECSPVVIRSGELLVGDYYFLLPYELISLQAPISYEAYATRGALPEVYSGHTSVNLGKGLELGWQGLSDYAQKCKTRFLNGSYEAEFLEGAAQIIALIRARIRAYAKKASDQARQTGSLDQAQEYQKIAERCIRLADLPPVTFYDALQWYFFWITFERSSATGQGGVRLDQIFYPYYQRDIQQGIQDDEQVRLLLECLFMKEVPFCSLGGVTMDGKDAVNSLSFLALEAYDQVGGTGNLSIRWHSGLNPQFGKLAINILSRHGGGTPEFVNDQTIIPSLVHFGYPLEQARDYNFSGCFWWTVPGKEQSYNDFAAVSGGRALWRALEHAHKLGCQAFEDLWQSYCYFLEDAVIALIESYQVIDAWLPKHDPAIVVSLLMDGCLEKGHSFNDGGAETSMMTVLYIGLATVADSLFALKKRVFEEGLISFDEVFRALEHNFVGYELVQKMLQSAPKYGSGHVEADELAVQVARHFKTCLQGYRTSRGFALRPAFYSYHRHTYEGQKLGATPDGRREGMPLSQGPNPSPGQARRGITALVQSVAKIGYTDVAGGAAHLHLYLRKCSKPVETLVALMQGSMQLGIPQLIINTVDARMLRDAIDHPDQYADLTIRVTGYSARFVQLAHELQEEIAARDSF